MYVVLLLLFNISHIHHQKFSFHWLPYIFFFNPFPPFFKYVCFCLGCSLILPLSLFNFYVPHISEIINCFSHLTYFTARSIHVTVNLNISLLLSCIQYFNTIQLYIFTMPLSIHHLWTHRCFSYLSYSK